jgi:hypothetical protein
MGQASAIAINKNAYPGIQNTAIGMVSQGMNPEYQHNYIQNLNVNAVNSRPLSTQPQKKATFEDFVQRCFAKCSTVKERFEMSNNINMFPVSFQLR